MSLENTLTVVWFSVAMLLWIAGAIYESRSDKRAFDGQLEIACWCWPLVLLMLLIFVPLYLQKVAAKWLGKKAGGR